MTRTSSPLEKGHLPSLNTGTISYQMRVNELSEQIKNYPTPIAGCDEQFNFLLEERDRLRNKSHRKDKMIEAMRDVINVLIARHHADPDIIAMLEDIIKEYED